MNNLGELLGRKVIASPHMPDFFYKTVVIKRSGGIYGMLPGSRRKALRRRKTPAIVVHNGVMFCSPATLAKIELAIAEQRGPS